MALVLLGVALACLSGLLWKLTGLAVEGTLGRNRFVGIRSAATMVSDTAWLAAHRAARRWLLGTAVLGFVVSAVVIVSQSWIALLAGCALMVLGSVGAKAVGFRAARSVTCVNVSDQSVANEDEFHRRGRGRGQSKLD